MTLVFLQVALLTPSSASVSTLHLFLFTPSILSSPLHLFPRVTSPTTCTPESSFGLLLLPSRRPPYRSRLLTPPDKVAMTTLADAYLSKMVNADNRLPLAGFIEAERQAELGPGNIGIGS